MPSDIPPWLDELLACPVDASALESQDTAYRCPACRRSYGARDGIVVLLPDHLKHLGAGADRAARPARMEPATEWVSDEMAWWDDYVKTDSQEPLRADAGIRGRARERNLFRHVREAVGPEPTVLELGAGSSRTVAGLWSPDAYGIRYVATDLSAPWLRSGAPLRGGGAAVQCDAVAWPFRDGVADVVLVLGVLHHLPDWRGALSRAFASLRPGGRLLLHEVIYKPRIFAGRRPSGVTDGWTSPHEGSVGENELRAHLDEHGAVQRWRREGTPLRFGAAHYGDLHVRLEQSPRLTTALELADQAFGRTLGRIRPSLGFNEILCVCRKPG